MAWHSYLGGVSDLRQNKMVAISAGFGHKQDCVGGSSSCEGQNRPLLIAGTQHQQTRKCLTIEIGPWAAYRCLTPRRSGWPMVGHDKTSILSLTFIHHSVAKPISVGFQNRQILQISHEFDWNSERNITVMATVSRTLAVSLRVVVTHETKVDCICRRPESAVITLELYC
jgi:hypothetical protein